LQIFVTVTDGQVKSKVECQIIVLGSDRSEPQHTRINNGPPGFPQLPPFFQNPPIFPVTPSVPRQTTDTTESISDDVASKTTTSVEQIPQSVQQNQTVIFVQKEDKDGERKTYDFIVLSIVIPITLIAVIPILVTILYWYLRKRRRYTSAKKMTVTFLLFAIFIVTFLVSFVLTTCIQSNSNSVSHKFKKVKFPHRNSAVS